MHAATVRDFEIPAKYGLRQTIGDTIGIGGIFRGLRTFPVLDGIAQDMLEICPDAWLLNYTNPMAMNIAYLAEAHPTLKVVGLCHSVYWTVHDLCRIVDVPLDEVAYAQRGRQPPGLAARLDARRRGPVSPAGQGDRTRPRAVPSGAVRHLPAARLLPDRDQRALHASTSPGTCTTTSEIERLRIPVGEYVRISEANLDDLRPDPRAALAAGERLPLVREATEYAPLVIHSMETGTTRHDHRQRRQPRPHRQPAKTPSKKICSSEAVVMLLYLIQQPPPHPTHSTPKGSHAPKPSPAIPLRGR